MKRLLTILTANP